MNRTVKKLLMVSIYIVFVSSCSTVTQNDNVMANVKALEASGDASGALNLLETEMIRQPRRLELSNYYRQLSSREKKFEDAINYFKQRTAESGAPNEMYYNLAFAYIDKIPTVGPMGSGFLSKRAIAQFQAVLDKYPDDWIATYGIGMNYLHWPDYFKKNDSSMVYLEKALELQKDRKKQPYHILTFIRLGDAYAKSGQDDKAYDIWQRGLNQFPGHPDLVARVEVKKEKIGEAMRALYNPNNSIGEINTDISVLWVDYVPKELVPLTKNPLKQAGVGGLVKGSRAGISKGQIGLFSWFMRNLPFLSDKSKYANVDMTSLGISQGTDSGNLASIVAHGMIMGFISQFEDDTPQQAKKKIDDMESFHKPFFHEGLGMGYAATASLEDVTELKKLVEDLRSIDPQFTRLHLAGAGMWYGLESSGNLEKVKTAFNYLGEFGEAYAYEGYGFSQTLFYFKSNDTLLKRGAKLPDVAAKSFYHGAGRALWILTGKDVAQFHKNLKHIPEKYRSDAISGYGMGVAFTKVEEPNYVFNHYSRFPSQAAIDQNDFYTGVTMGYVIRHIGEPSYLAKVLQSQSALNRCRISNAIKVGEMALTAVQSGGGDLHANWRGNIHRELSSNNRTSVVSTCGQIES